jgi:hypothetical protein
LSVLWPWKTAIIKTFETGEKMKEKVIGYDYGWPQMNDETLFALVIMISGILILTLIEKAASKNNQKL